MEYLSYYSVRFHSFTPSLLPSFLAPCSGLEIGIEIECYYLSIYKYIDM